MKALVFEHYGKAEEVLKLKDIPDLEPKDGEVKVRMLYSPINPSDIYNTIEGTYKDAYSNAIWNLNKLDDEVVADPFGTKQIPKLPHIPGLEGVGYVVKAGKGLRGKFLVGKRVMVLGAEKGNWQEYNVVDAKQAIPVNKNLTDEEAATFFVNPATAFIMVKKVLNCKEGSFLLQSAANSELGKMVIRLGKHYGFKTVNLIRNEDQRKHLLELGADYVINTENESVKQRVFDITNGKGVDYAIDPVGGKLGSEMTQCLGLKGHMLVYGTLSNQPLQFASRNLMTPVAKLEGFFLANYMLDRSMLQKLSIIRQVGKLIQKGVLKSEIGKVYPLEDFRAAFQEVNKAGNQGKVLFKISE
ncbi:MAG: zinc-dependent alcohol dehydrogenase family protein [Chitinophagales bacterium]